MGTPPQLTTQDARSGCHLDHQMALCYPVNRKVCPSIFRRILNDSPTPFPIYFPSPCFTAFLFILRWLLTTLRHATTRMASHSAKRYTQLNLKHPQAHPLVANDVPPASGNPSPSRNNQDSSNTQDDTAAKSERNRAYPHKEGDGHTASSADRKRLTSTRSGVGQDTRRAKPSPSSDLHTSSGPANGTPRKDGATGKSNGKKRRPDVVGAEDASTSKSRRPNLPALNKPGLRPDVSFKVKEESPWRTYDEGYDLRVGGLVTVAKKKRPGSKMAKGRPASETVAIRKLSGSTRNANLSTLLRVQGEYFVKCTGAYEFGAELYVLEHMPISLVQVIATPKNSWTYTPSTAALTSEEIDRLTCTR